MDNQRWRQIDELFQAAVELNPEQRASFLEDACAGDHALRSEVESMLASDSDGWDFVEKPALEVAAALLVDEQPQFAAGDTIGHYRIINAIGRGGMGEVYLAQDERLGRKVALKLLPADVTGDQSRMRRFQQEARAASALNHPNIITIYDINELDGRCFIASEFIEGETLRHRLSHQRMTISEALDIAIQIASALYVAHEAGIVHRDIKPENIMLRRDGYVKVLDFGLAKLAGQHETTNEASAAERPDISSGLVMGTVKYMSPEQARGQQVDSRSDIFSFGVVLYEMVAGRAPFEGESASELIRAILKKEPPLLTNEPDEMQRIISKALCKKKEDRYQTIEDLLADLKELRENKAVSGAGAQVATRKANASAISTSEAVAVSTVSTIEYIVSGIKRHKNAAAFILASLALVGVSLVFSMNRLSSKPRAASREMKITRIPNMERAIHVAISPTGEYITYAEMSGPAKQSAEESLWVLTVAANERVQIVPPAKVEYEGLTYSRDGQDIFYVNDGILYKIPAGGGDATKVLSDVGGTISFAPDGAQLAFSRGLNAEETALMVANVDGTGERVIATRKRPEFLAPDGPAWSPDGRLIACWVGVIAKNGSRTVMGFDPSTGEEKRITDQTWDDVGSRAIWLSDGSGLIAAASQGTEMQIWEIPYPSGEAHRITSDLNYSYSQLGLTADGKNLVALQSAWRSAVWLLPNGDSSAAAPITSGEHQDYRHVAWTPDGRILYASNVGTNRDIWIMNGDGTNPKQLTANAGVNLQPQPSADGRFVLFSSNRANEAAFNIWRMDIDGSNAVQLTHGDGEGQPVCSPNGRWVVYSAGGPNTTPLQKTLWKVSIDGGEPVQLCDKPSSGADISPDGTLIACWYARDAAPPMKVAIIPFAGGSPVKIFDATMTAIHPVRFSPGGQAINYINARPFVSNIWSQPVSGGPPAQLTQFTSEIIGGFDWSRDGHLLCSRAHSVQDVILISDFR
ncbi:MAG TPA: protein kinase [Blastocatellia bacterium]|nr:protein kinase [Blastocatellia bacterium]